jgi:tetratricopeptide (TPR) repeat protein
MTDPADRNNSDTGNSGSEKKPINWLTIVTILVVVLIVAVGAYFICTPKETPLEKAVKMVKENKSALAVPLLEELSKQSPPDFNVYPWLAQAYLDTERFAEGRTALDTAFRVRCRDNYLPLVVESYSDYYQGRNDYEQAERLYSAAMTVVKANLLANGRAQMYMRWADADLAKNDLDSATKHMTQAGEFSESLEEPLKSQVPHRLADCYRRMAAAAELRNEDNTKAIELLEKALSVSDEPATRIALGALYEKEDNADKAIENYQAVCSFDKNNLTIRHRLIDLLLAKKDWNAAQVALTDLVDKEKTFENYELLADLNLRLENYAGAVRCLEEANALKPSPALLKQLLTTLNTWSALLAKQNKAGEAMSVKGHAERVEEELAQLLKDEKKDEEKEAPKPAAWSAGSPPVAVMASHNWLSAGSLTPEGEIKIKNISGQAVTELSLTAVFFDHTRRQSNGSVGLPVVTPNSNPFAPGAERTLYFSCPNIVKEGNQLGVMIFWKGKLLREFPVVKQR